MSMFLIVAGIFIMRRLRRCEVFCFSVTTKTAIGVLFQWLFATTRAKLELNWFEGPESYFLESHLEVADV